MNVIASVDLTPGESGELAHIIGCAEEQLVQKLAAYASAALSEYVTMFLGQRVFRRGADLLEYRLVLLIKEAFDNQIPNEQDVCNLISNYVE